MTHILVIITTAFVSTGGLTSVMMNYYHNINHKKFIIDFASSNKIEFDLLAEIQRNNSKYFQLPPRKKIIKYLYKIKQIGSNYDIVHIHANSATATLELFASLLAHIPKRIIHIHTSKTEHPIIHKTLLPFFHKLYTDKVACSQQAGEWIFKSNYNILPNAINCEKFRYTPKQRYNFNTENEKFIIFGHIGKFMAAKNHLFLIQIFNEISKKIPQAKLLLIGDGYLKHEIICEIEKYDLATKVILTGLRKDIPQLLNSMDIFIFPSLWEGLPMSVLEAQASGLQCILSENVTKEVALTDLVYYYSLERSPKEWANFIINKLDFKQNRTERSIKAIEQITQQGYDIKNATNRLENLYS